MSTDAEHFGFPPPAEPPALPPAAPQADAPSFAPPAAPTQNPFEFPGGQPFGSPAATAAPADDAKGKAGSRKAKPGKAPKPPKQPKAPAPPTGEKASKQPKGQKDPNAVALRAANTATRPWPAPSKPSAVLVPRYVRERRDAARTARAMVIMLAIVVALSVAGLILAIVSAKRAESTLSNAQSAQQAMQTQVTALGPVATYYDSLSARQQIAADAMKSDLLYDEVFKRVFAHANEAGVAVTDLSLTAGTTPCEGSNPFRANPALGCMSVSINTPNAKAATRFIDLINEDSEWFNAAYGSGFGEITSGGGDMTVAFNYTPKALSLAYVPESEREAVRQSYYPAIDPVTGQITAPVTAPGTAPGAVPGTTPVTPAG